MLWYTSSRVRKLLILPFLLLSSASIAQFQATKNLTIEEANQDLDKAVSYLFQYHPDFPSLTDSVLFMQEVERVRSEFRPGMTAMDFYTEVSQLNSFIHCVHTDFKLEGSAREWKSKEALYPPFSLEQVGQSYHVNYSSDPKIQAGDQVLSIDGKSAPDIVEYIVKRLPADGYNNTRKFSALSRSFPQYYTLYIQPKPLDYELRIKRGADTLAIRTSPLNYTQSTELAQASRTSFDSYRSYFIDSSKTAWLQQFTFRGDLINENDYAKFLSGFFKKIKDQGVEKLIIDVRGNGGGYSEYAQSLLAYLVKDSFNYANRLILKTNDLPRKELLEIPNTFLRFPQGMNMCETPDGKQAYQWNGHKILEKKGPQKDAFNGKLIILMDGGSVSTSSEFISLAQHLTDAEFIGEEMGGQINGDNGGVLAFFPLKNSGLALRVPLVKYELAVNPDMSGRGVLPAFEIQTEIPTVETRFRWDPQLSNPFYRKDPYVQTVWKLIGKNKQ